MVSCFITKNTKSTHDNTAGLGGVIIIGSASAVLLAVVLLAVLILVVLGVKCYKKRKR